MVDHRRKFWFGCSLLSSCVPSSNRRIVGGYDKTSSWIRYLQVCYKRIAPGLRCVWLTVRSGCPTASSLIGSIASCRTCISCVRICSSQEKTSNAAGVIKVSSNETNGPPRTLRDIERRSRSIASDWGFSLRFLITFSNLAAIFAASIAWTEGLALLLIVPMAFVTPGLIAIYIAFGMIGDHLRSTKPRIIVTKSSRQKSPFDD